ncbi:hypothetical protein pipiens_014044 [Culex pipiens pipiens]|uniref:F-box domain-containing protein n=1 Tax=Culex pipiens pipiens TaxID=38569 RepID=A0ABD1CW24_CULPP
MCVHTRSARPPQRGFADLPPEIQEYIFDYLPLADRKAAACVNSHWLTLAFSGRFLARTRLKIPSWTELDICSRMLLAKSGRRHRNIFAAFGSGSCEPRDLHLLLDILVRFAETIECVQSPTMFSSQQLTAIVNTLPRLKELEVAVGDVYNFEHEGLMQLARLVKPIAAQQFSMKSDMLIIVFQGTPKVKKLRIDHDIDSQVFETLTQNCSELQELNVHVNVRDIPSLESLSKLQKLRKLKLEGSFTSNQMRACSPIPGMRKLYIRVHRLDNITTFFHQLERILPNLHTIHFRINSLPLFSKRIVQQITRGFQSLSKFTIEGSPVVMRPELAFQSLRDRPDGVPEDDDDDLETDSKIGRLRVSNCTDFRDADLLRLATTFPELTYVELCKSRWITEEGLRVFAEVLPNCRIELNDK